VNLETPSAESASHAVPDKPASGQPAGAVAGAAFVSARDVRRVFRMGTRELPVLDGVSLELAAGDMVALTGASGAGKSTLLHLLGTLDQPDEGEIAIDGVVTSTLSPTELARFRNRKIGFVFQFHHLLPEFTALENVAMPLLIQGLSQRDAKDRALAMLTSVGLAARVSHRPSELSGGEQQRVAVARALVAEPKLLLADEPTGNLDERTGAGIHDLLCELNARYNLTMVIATHSTGFASRLPRQMYIQAAKLHEGVYARELEHSPSAGPALAPAQAPGGGVGAVTPVGAA
jgi:lipoprotein-releasing system ATP-binding protein